jgi:hypothetical protein
VQTAGDAERAGRGTGHHEFGRGQCRAGHESGSVVHAGDDRYVLGAEPEAAQRSRVRGVGGCVSYGGDELGGVHGVQLIECRGARRMQQHGIAVEQPVRIEQRDGQVQAPRTRSTSGAEIVARECVVPHERYAVHVCPCCYRSKPTLLRSRSPAGEAKASSSSSSEGTPTA